MTRFLTVEHVIAIHRAEVEGAALRDRGLLESAVGRPQHTFDGEDLRVTIHEKAGALFESLAQNQAFTDGNKRTAVLAVNAFYALNGFVLRADDSELIHLAVSLAIDDEMDAAKCASRFEVWAVPLDEILPD